VLPQLDECLVAGAVHADVGLDEGRNEPAVIAGLLVEVARGHHGSPYSWLGAIGGTAYLIAVIALRLRG
jgi:hypothetical protein